MHLHRETVLRTAVTTILPQLRPRVVKPLEGNVSDIVEATQPMVETILDLCGQKAAEKEGTSLWVAARIKKDDYSYVDCCEHPELMQAMVDKKIAFYRSKGSPDGSYILPEGVQVPDPDATYSLSEHRVGRRRATAPSLTTKFLRGGGVVQASEDMRNNNEYPVVIAATPENELGEDWCNHVDIRWKFAIRYLAGEGITETSKEADVVLAYVFHGKYTYARKIKGVKQYFEKPIIHALHFNLTNHRSRFVKGVAEHFKLWFKLLDEHKDWEAFMSDRGVGNPPLQYNIGVEVGIRSYALQPDAKLTMGVGKARVCTKWLYKGITPWRKMETYITAVRFRRGKTSYKKWQNFDWFDFVQRDNLAVTFNKRHLPLADGEDHFQGRLKDPEEWSEAAAAPPVAISPVAKKKKGSTRGKKTPVKVKVEPTAPRRFDSQTGRLVNIPVDLT